MPLPGGDLDPHDGGMTSPLDILVIESHPGAAVQAARQLEAAGHHVGRCHDSDCRGFPCRGVFDPQERPLSAVPDVALLLRSRVDPRPTPLEHGVSCAIRAGFPLVEGGPRRAAGHSGQGGGYSSSASEPTSPAA